MSVALTSVPRAVRIASRSRTSGARNRSRADSRSRIRLLARCVAARDALDQAIRRRRARLRQHRGLRCLRLRRRLGRYRRLGSCHPAYRYLAKPMPAAASPTVATSPRTSGASPSPSSRSPSSRSRRARARARSTGKHRSLDFSATAVEGARLITSRTHHHWPRHHYPVKLRWASDPPTARYA